MTVITGTENADTLTGGADNDTITGLAGDDILQGVGGDDTLDGGAGNDNLVGGIGNDTLFGGDDNDVLRGRDGDDVLNGDNGNDYVQGGEGNDTINGGAGQDRAAYYLSLSTDVQTGATVNLLLQGVAQDTGHGMDILTGIEHLSGTTFADVLTGDAGNNWLWGLGGGDTLTGGDGNDLLEVGTGDNTVAGGNGVDTLSFFNNNDFASGVSVSLLLQGAAQNTQGGLMVISGVENLSGSTFADTLIGDTGDNLLAGAENADNLSGGDGNDTLLGDGIVWGELMLQIVDMATYFGPEAGVVSGNDILNGGAGNDTLYGGGADDMLSGGNGADFLDGGLGNDLLDGGKDIDLASYALATSAVTVSLALIVAQDTLGAGVDTLIAVESLEGSLFGDTLTGNGIVNVLSGLAGDDILDGGKGNDVLNGGEGNDTASYATSASAVTVSLLTGLSSGGAGKDKLVSIENVTGSAFRDVLIGDGGANVLRGGDNNDTIDGGAGDDVMAGDAGTDLVTYAASTAGVTVSLAITTAQDTVGAGIDTLSGFEDLTGSKFADNLTGDSLANRITGGLGADVLSGGEGKDRFVYLAIQDSSLKNTDLITDLSRSDILDLSAIDANSVLAGDQAFSLAAAFSGVAGQYTLAFNAVTGQTQLLADVNGDSKADFALLFTGDVTGLTGAWVL